MVILKFFKLSVKFIKLSTFQEFTPPPGAHSICSLAGNGRNRSNLKLYNIFWRVKYSSSKEESVLYLIFDINVAVPCLSDIPEISNFCGLEDTNI